MITSRAYLCIDAGGTFFKYTAFDEKDNQLFPVSAVPANSEGTLTDILSVYEKIYNEVSENFEVCRIGIATPGPFDYINKTSLMKHKFKSIYGVNLENEIQKTLSKDIPVMFMSDTNAFLKGAYDGNDICIGITIGTGLGIAISKDGELVTNQYGGPIEVIYNKQIDGTHIAEDYVSRKGISRAYEELGGNSGCSPKDISDFARKGDEKACKVYDYMGKVLGIALKDIVLKYNAKVIYLGGQISKSVDLFADSVKKEINTSTEIMVAENSDIAALLGIYRELCSETY